MRVSSVIIDDLDLFGVTPSPFETNTPPGDWSRPHKELGLDP
jgi:hypothetical protein